MRKIVNSEQIDHCRDNGSDRELHRLLEAPAARFNIILLIIIVILVNIITTIIDIDIIIIISVKIFTRGPTCQILMLRRNYLIALVKPPP